MNRLPTGILGFDDLMQGGFIPESTNLISGAPGTGKSVFSLQFLYSGAQRYNEKGLYISFEQREEDLINQANVFKMDYETMIKEGKIGVYSVPINILDEEIVGMILRLIESFKPQRLVIDSISTFSISAPTYIKMSKLNVADASKYFIYKFITDLKKLNCTTLITSELHQEDWISEKSVAEFAVDSIIVLKYQSTTREPTRTVSIKKARQTKFNEYTHSFNFGAEGIEINVRRI